MVDVPTASRIKLLSPRLANQIAAGEVVERPASVLKELLENSLDIGATRIEVTLEHGGKTLITVQDNGGGIAKDDLALALTKHATSKITQVEDLAAIASLGFRGEALASISAVSRLLLSSRCAEQDAWQVRSEGPTMEANVTPCAHPLGTTVRVADLFFNVPARRKFLRTDKTEWLHCQALLQRIALSAFEVTFKITHQGKQINYLPAATTEAARAARVAKLCGKGFVDGARFIDIHAAGLRLWGWLGDPAQARSQADLQYFFLNHRAIKDRLVNHAIREAFGERLYPGRYPCYVLYLTVDPGQVDVNVHPTKHEVRFSEARLIHDFLVNALTRGLTDEVDACAAADDNSGGLALADKGGLESVDVLTVLGATTTQVPSSAASQPASMTAATTPARFNASLADTKQQVDLEAAMRGELSPLPFSQVSAKPAQRRYPAAEGSEVLGELSFNLTGPPAQPCAEFLGLCQGRYLVRASATGIELVDGWALRYEVALLTLKQQWQHNQALASKPLLLPQLLTFPEPLLTALLSVAPTLKALGFICDQQGPEQLALRSQPSILTTLSFKPALPKLLGLLKEEASEQMPGACLRYLARQVNAGSEALTSFQAKALLEQMSKVDSSAAYQRCVKHTAFTALERLDIDGELAPVVFTSDAG